MTDGKAKSSYLFVDDVVGIGEPISPEVLLSIPLAKGRVIGGTLGPFGIREFEKLKMPEMNILTREIK